MRGVRRNATRSSADLWRGRWSGRGRKIHATRAFGRSETSMRGDTGKTARARELRPKGSTAATRANTHPPQRPARRCPTRHPVPDRLFEARASTRVVPTGIEPALSSKLGTQKGGQKRHTRGPQGSLPFRRIRRRRPGTSHEAARTTTKDMAPRRSPATADDHPEASWGGG